MSGGKFALPALAAGLLVEMMMAQQVAGMAAGQLRGEAESEERQRRLEETRSRFAAELAAASEQLQIPEALHPAHKTRLLQTVRQLQHEVQTSQSEKELWQVAQATPQLLADVKTAMMNKRFHDSQETKFEADRLQLRLTELDHALEQIGTAEFASLDPAGHEGARRAIAAARAAVETGATDTETLLTTAVEAIQMHGQHGVERQTKQREERAKQEQAATEIYALIAGLKRDPMVVRWHAAELAKLEERLTERLEERLLTKLDVALQADPNVPRKPADTAERTGALLEAAREQAAEMIKQAAEAQFRADQRDYITRGISRSLSEMGFVVSAPQDEYPDHPATAKVLQAASASGKAIFVSVPVEGEVWYEVDGYVKTTQTSLGGDMALACDEGEQVLAEMHARLETEFQVGMSEIWWEGKDPNRVLRRADALPVGAGQTQGSPR